MLRAERAEMNVNYLSYFLMLVCSILAVNIYRLRKNNTDVADQLVKADEESVELTEKKIRCENDLKSKESAFKELTETLNQRQKENEEVQKNLDACNKDLSEKKAEKENLEKKTEETEAPKEPEEREAFKEAEEDEEDGVEEVPEDESVKKYL